MYTILITIGGFIGLIVTGAAFYTVWSVMEQRKQQSGLVAGHVDQSVMHRDVLHSWTAMDYAAIGVFVIGVMLMIADLFAVIRDRESYPYYHYGYLFSAFIFVLVGMMFMVVRLGVILRPDPNIPAEVTSAPESKSTFLHDDNQPDKTDETHERV
ncbi:MAG: hypothetical protein WD424_00095 [Paenibacillaceae bacterium]